MADLTITASDVSIVKRFDDLPPLPKATGEALVKGNYARLDTSTGHATGGNGGSAAEIGYGGVIYNEENNLVKITRNAILDIGDALSALDFGAKVFLSNTDKTLADTAGTVSQVVGYVVPGTGQTTFKKLLRVEVQDG